jgi:hypothetical protein
MKRFLFLVTALFFFCTSAALAAKTEAEAPVYENVLLSFSALSVGVVFFVEAIRRLAPSLSGTVIRAISWLVGIMVCFFGWFNELGFLAGLEWYGVLMYGLGISLASNGIADTGLIQWIVSLFARKKT